jgi:hypothetical protein
MSKGIRHSSCWFKHSALASYLQRQSAKCTVALVQIQFVFLLLRFLWQEFNVQLQLLGMSHAKCWKLSNILADIAVSIFRMSWIIFNIWCGSSPKAEVVHPIYICLVNVIVSKLHLCTRIINYINTTNWLHGAESSWEVIVTQSKNLLFLYGTQRLITVFTRFHHWTFSWTIRI